MAELERRAPGTGQESKKVGQPRQVLLEVRRKLEEGRAELLAELLGGTQEVAQLAGGVLEALSVRDRLRGLEREAKSLGNLGRPLQQEPLGRHPVEGVVDLDRAELRGVEAEKILRLAVLRVERTLPLLVRVAAGAHQETHRV